MERVTALAVPLNTAHFALGLCVCRAVRFERSTVLQRIVCLREPLLTWRTVALGTYLLWRQEDVACLLACLRGFVTVCASHVLVWHVREWASLQPALRDVRRGDLRRSACVARTDRVAFRAFR